MRKALVLILLLAACKEEVAEAPDPVALTEEAVSHYCQMNVLEHGGPKAQIYLKGLPEPLFFSQVRDAVAYLKSSERDAGVVAVYVSDMGAAESWNRPGSDNWVDANGAVFVVDADVRGGMGAPEIVPFVDPAEAAKFVAAYGGSAMPLEDIPAEAALAPVDLNAEMEEPQWPMN